MLAAAVDVDVDTDPPWWNRFVVEPNGCWRWTGTLNPAGYGMTWSNGRTQAAHRRVFEDINGVHILSCMDIDHLCRNHACVNPEHLEVVTRQENIRRGWVSRRTEGIAPPPPTECAHGHGAAAWYAAQRGGGYCRACANGRKRLRRNALRMMTNSP